MFGNQYRYTIEVANEETQIYEAVAIVNEPYEVLPLIKKLDLFKIVVYRQDSTGIYNRSDDFVIVDLENKDLDERQKELIVQLNVLSNQ